MNEPPALRERSLAGLIARVSSDHACAVQQIEQTRQPALACPIIPQQSLRGRHLSEPVRLLHNILISEVLAEHQAVVTDGRRSVVFLTD